jgi:hypothetical protein
MPEDPEVETEKLHETIHEELERYEYSPSQPGEGRCCSYTRWPRNSSLAFAIYSR